MVYDHLLYMVQNEPPNRLIERFHTLFIDGTGYQDPQVVSALDKIVASKQAEQEFKFVLNRCCHILINRWQLQPQLQSAIPELVEVFSTQPARRGVVSARSRYIRRLHELVALFLETDQFLTLSRLASVIDERAEAGGGSRPLGTLIRRYPYLYEHCLMSEDSSYEQQQTIRQVQQERQHEFEVDLSKYVTYRVRVANQSQSRSGVIQPVHNPTLLNDRELSSALKQFAGKVEHGKTYRDNAESFRIHMQGVRSYREFKDDLYSYIASSVDDDYGRRRFKTQLQSQLMNTLPDSDGKKFDDFLLVRTCDQLLKFMVVESPRKPQHFVLVDLITNVGPIVTAGLLLKIVLLCAKVKPYLEKRCSILFNHYEQYTRESVEWLVKILENINIALSTNFGAVDLSILRGML